VPTYQRHQPANGTNLPTAPTCQRHQPANGTNLRANIPVFAAGSFIAKPAFLMLAGNKAAP